jgi:hypothetical protein
VSVTCTAACRAEPGGSDVSERAPAGRRDDVRESCVKFLLLIYMNPTAWESLTQEERDAVLSGHADYQKMLTETGEMVVTHALGEPEKSSVVRVRDGMLSETDGPYVESKEYMAGYYLIECADQARANQIAGMMPDAKFNAVEVRPIVFSSGPGA